MVQAELVDEQPKGFMQLMETATKTEWQLQIVYRAWAQEGKAQSRGLVTSTGVGQTSRIVCKEISREISSRSFLKKEIDVNE